MKKAIWRSLLFALTFILVAPFLAAQTSTTPTPIPKKEIEAFVEKRRIEYEIPGVQVSIDNGEELWTFVTGWSDLEKKTPLTKDDKFRIGSMTKIFTAMTVLQLIDESKDWETWAKKYNGRPTIALDDELTVWLPDTIPNTATMTINDLLRHLTGLYDFTHSTDWLLPFTFFPEMPFPREKLIDIVIPEVRTNSPGKEWNYSSTNFYLLGMIIEAATGRPWKYEVDTRFVNNPELGFQNTLIPDKNMIEIPPPRSLGYVNYGRANLSPLLADTLSVRRFAHPSYTWAAGDAFSTSEDMCRWIKAIGEGILISPELYKKQFTWFPIYDLFGTPVDGWGMGLGLAHVTQYEDRYVYTAGHRGQIYGFDCAMEWVINKRVAVTVFGNRTLLNSSNIEDAILFDLVAEFIQ